MAGGTERGGKTAFAVLEIAALHIGVDQLCRFPELPQLTWAFWCRWLGWLVSQRGVADEFLECGTLLSRCVGQGVFLKVFQEATVADAAALGRGILVPLKIFFALILFPAVAQVTQRHGVVEVLDLRRVGQDLLNSATIAVVSVERFLVNHHRGGHLGVHHGQSLVND